MQQKILHFAYLISNLLNLESIMNLNVFTNQTGFYVLCTMAGLGILYLLYPYFRNLTPNPEEIVSSEEVKLLLKTEVTVYSYQSRHSSLESKYNILTDECLGKLFGIRNPVFFSNLGGRETNSKNSKNYRSD